MSVTTSKDVEEAIEALAKQCFSENGSIDDAGAEALLRTFRTLAAHIDDVAQLPVVTAKLINDALNGVKALEAKTEALAVPAAPDKRGAEAGKTRLAQLEAFVASVERRLIGCNRYDGSFAGMKFVGCKLFHSRDENEWCIGCEAAKLRENAPAALPRDHYIREALAEEAPPAVSTCRGCGKPLLKENQNLADGCPCNSSRGVNHGLVPTDTCTCKVCDPNQSGSVRHTRLEMVWTTPESRAALIAKHAPGYEECSEEEADERDGHRAALWRTFQSDWELAWIGERANGAYIWLRSVRRPGIPRPGNAVYATPPGFEIRSFSEAASFGGFTLGYHEEVGQFILRKTEDGDMPGTGFRWIAPAPQPDAQKLVVALISEGFSVAEVEGYARNAVSRALEKCR